MSLELLEVHVSVKPAAHGIRVKGVIGHSVPDSLIDAVADPNAQFTPAVARVDDSPVLQNSLPLRWTCKRCFLQCHHRRPSLRHADYGYRQLISLTLGRCLPRNGVREVRQAGEDVYLADEPLPPRPAGRMPVTSRSRTGSPSQRPPSFQAEDSICPRLMC